MFLEWIGGTPRVFVPDAGVYAGRGVPVEVPDSVSGREPAGDDLGEGLLAQRKNWRRAAAAVTDNGGEG